MDKNKRLYSYMLSFMLLASLPACNLSNSDQEQGSFKYRSYFKSCNNQSIKGLKTIQDSLNTFQVSIPEDWSVEKILSDDFKGLLAADTNQLFKNDSLVMLSINQYKIVHTQFEDFIRVEREKMEKDSLDLLYSSSYSKNEFHAVVNDRSSVSTELTQFHVYRFIKPNRILLITLSTDRTQKPKETLCQYWYIIRSVQFVNTTRGYA